MRHAHFRLPRTVLHNSFFLGGVNSVVFCADGSIAVGLLTVLTYKELEKALSSKGFELKDLDFLVCNAGSYIFCRTGSGEFVADEAWEELVSYRWDKKLVVRHCQKLLIVLQQPSPQGPYPTM